MKKQTGITLVALVITIIVMLILVGVTVTVAIKENGTLAQTKNAKKSNYIAELKQEADLVFAEFETIVLSSKNPEVTKQELVTEENLNEELKEVGTIKENSLVFQDDGSISFIIIANETNEELEYTYKLNRQFSR